MSKKVYYSVVAEFYNGVIRCTYTTLLEPKRGLYYTWEFEPSPGSLYLIGRYRHAKVGKEKVEEVKAIKEEELGLYNIYELSAISRIHLLVRTTSNEFEVVNVGVSPIKIIPYEEFKEKSKKEIVGKRVENRDLTKLWILPLLVSLLSLPMLLIIFSRNLTGLFVFNSPSLYFLIFILMLVMLFLFVRYSKLIVREKKLEANIFYI
jgi:hypothetical protein